VKNMKIEKEIMSLWAATINDLDGIAREARINDHEAIGVLLSSLSSIIDKRFERILELTKEGDHHDRD